MRNIQSTKISKRNQTVVPAAVRKSFNLKPGDKILWKIIYVGGSSKAIAEPAPKKWSKQSRGVGKALWKNINIDAYINNLRNEWKRQIRFFL